MNIEVFKENNAPLTVYKASAGSGKTFTLSVEYIKLLVCNPLAYRNILAVTFTNKATEEMKSRIISQLYGIWKQLDTSKDYTQKITTELSLSEKTVADRAGIALRNILHDYSYFRIETIDTFFQSILRNLARELDLTANLRVELNDAQVEQQAVDKLIEELSPKDEVFKWILSYIKENVQEEKSWNVIGLIKKFGENIFKEFYKTNSDRLKTILDNPDYLDSFKKEMRSMMASSRKRMEQIGKEFFDELERRGLDENDFFYGKSGVCSYFIKLRNGIFDSSIMSKRVADAMEDSDKWIKKTAKDKQRTAITRAAVDERLLDMLKDAEAIRPKEWKRYKSADLTQKHINQLRLLGDIEKKVRELNAESNSFLLSDTQTLLHALIDGSDTPFIFEKTGTLIKHVMIDEFQDTSTVQWKNFKVLIDECISHEKYGSLIVGDVKQSIYRWRDGDWRLLSNIRREFPTLGDKIRQKDLDTNYRSERNIISFNNSFFKSAAQTESERLRQEYGQISPDGIPNPSDETLASQIQDAYKDVEQKFPESKKQEPNGKVEVTLIPAEDYEDQMMELTYDATAEMIEAGIAPNTIAIIVRSNRTIRQVAEYFSSIHPEIKIVSDEAFRLESSVAVNIVINALRYLVNPDDKISIAYIGQAIEKHGKRSGQNATAKLQAMRTDLLSTSLYDAIERIFIALDLDEIEGQGAYVCTFFDCLDDFVADNAADISSFLEEWDENIHKKTIQENDINGVRLLTIHKSKGLEFDNVIMPFCDWELDKGKTIWCEPHVKPFDGLPLASIDYSLSNMKGTIYESDYKNEHFQNTIDDLNLLYVAFTRARTNLYVMGRRGNSRLRSSVIEAVLPNVAEELTGERTECDVKKDEPISFSYGTLCAPGNTKAGCAKSPSASSEKNVFRIIPERTNVRIQTFANRAVFRQSNKSREFIDDNNETDRTRYIKLGCVLHNVFSRIRTAADIDGALTQLEFDGITDENLSPDKLRKMLLDRLANPKVAEWFSGKWKVFNECTILSNDPSNGNKVSQHRPDRVMTDGRKITIVDFKFGSPRPEYHEQVRTYMALVKQMGYEDIEGYLWFVFSDRIEKVEW